MLRPEESTEQREEIHSESTALYFTGDVLEEMFQEKRNYCDEIRSCLNL